MLLFFILCILLFTLAYSILLWKFIHAWDNGNSPLLLLKETSPVSIIIPVRNEANNIIKTLENVFYQNYPDNLIEVILIDDHSNDNTSELVTTHFPEVILIENDINEIGKKASLTKGINHTSNSIIISLDGDCYPSSNNWLNTLVGSLINSDSLALTAPVILKSNNSIWHNFQALENMGMMLTTAAGYETQLFQLSNGANLIFYKSTFQQVGGFKGNEHRASGDDMYLFEKIELEHPGKTGFIKSSEAAVITKPSNTLNEYINQRIRWGTKNKSLKNNNLKLVLGFVFLFNLLLVCSLILLPFVPFPLVMAILLSWLVKINIDYFMLKKAAEFFKQSNILQSYWTSIFIYPFMISITGLLSIFKSTYIWKERKME